MKTLLLVSSSTTHGSGYLDHCASAIEDVFGEVSRVLFVPYALHDLDAYATRARERLEPLGYRVDSIHDARSPARAAQDAEALFIGGGNSFRLLERLYRHDLLRPIRERVEQGAPYVGTSAGSNVACVSIKTTNDMPIVAPPRLEALNLVPFNINPHYLDPDPASTHMGETRETRIREFHEENDPIVVGLREGAMLRIDGSRVRLLGTVGARVFFKGRSSEEFAPGANLDFLLRPSEAP